MRWTPISAGLVVLLALGALWLAYPPPAPSPPEVPVVPYDGPAQSMSRIPLAELPDPTVPPAALPDPAPEPEPLVAAPAPPPEPESSPEPVVPLPAPVAEPEEAVTLPVEIEEALPETPVEEPMQAERRPPPDPAPVPPLTDVQALRDDYLRRFHARIEREKQYPPQARRMRREGRVELLIGIDSAGALIQLDVLRSSGHLALDQAALEAVRQAAPFPPPPPEAFDPQPRFALGLEFSLR